MADSFRDSDIKRSPVPADVLAYWRAKKLRVGFDHRDVYGEEHDYAFSAAKIMRVDVLDALRDELDKSITEGKPFLQFVKDLRPRMKALGWWDEHEVTDPQTGKVVRVNPPQRLRTIFETNVRTARAVGQYDRIQRTKKSRPFLLYQLGPSERHRPEHVAWHGVLLPVDDAFWETRFPPCGWGCRCWVRTVSAREADELENDGVMAPNPEPELDDNGLPTGHLIEKRVPVQRVAPPIDLIPWLNRRTGETQFVPRGVDPGFEHTPGIGRDIALSAAE